MNTGKESEGYFLQFVKKSKNNHPVFQEFEQNHDPKWDLRTCVREYVYLYIDHFGNNDLPQLQMRPDQQTEYHQTSVGMV